MRIPRAELETYRGASVPDVLSDGVKLVFVGVNPGLRSAATQASFANRGNRFFPALHLAGITDHVIDTSSGFRPDDVDQLAKRGVGLTTLVNFATAKASELTDQQLVDGRRSFEATMAAFRPRVAAMLGVTAYRIAFSSPTATTGRQEIAIGETRLWVVPNPSGLNAHYSLADLAAAYREVAIAAGIQPYPPDAVADVVTSR
ncbi:mismatch-specific DNA-glycosylase [Leifsonia sp. NPDC058248]|uniref:mismatch-specific DNA-glycosylase n=1 Tax=Leifsonia sp. NPDC058248 TaxID=3346402 RepID=UPI0036DA981D